MEGGWLLRGHLRCAWGWAWGERPGQTPGGRNSLVQPHLPVLLPHQNRGRLADKRTVALPAARSLKKERTPSFSASDGDSDGSGPTCGRRPGLKQEDGPHIRIMKRRYLDQGRTGRHKAQMGLELPAFSCSDESVHTGLPHFPRMLVFLGSCVGHWQELFLHLPRLVSPPTSALRRSLAGGRLVAVGTQRSTPAWADAPATPADRVPVWPEQLQQQGAPFRLMTDCAEAASAPTCCRTPGLL